MKRDTLKKNIVSILGTAVVFAICLLTGILFLTTKYFLYFYFFITALFLGATNGLFLVLRYIETHSGGPNEETEKKRIKLNINCVLWAKVLSYIFYVVVFYLCNTKVFSYAKTIPSIGRTAAIHGVISLILFVCLIIFDRVCKYQDKKGPFTDAILENNRIFYKLLCFQTLLSVVYVIYESLDLYNIQKYIGYVHIVCKIN